LIPTIACTAPVVSLGPLITVFLALLCLSPSHPTARLLTLPSEIEPHSAALMFCKQKSAVLAGGTQNTATPSARPSSGPQALMFCKQKSAVLVDGTQNTATPRARPSSGPQAHLQTQPRRGGSATKTPSHSRGGGKMPVRFRGTTLPLPQLKVKIPPRRRCAIWHHPRY